MDFTHFTAGSDDDGRRIDKILRKFLREENLSSLYKSLRKGLIKVNGKKCQADFRVSQGNDIEIASFLLESKKEEKKADVTSPLKKEWIIFKNQALLFINKPYDIPVQPNSSGMTSLTEIVQSDYQANHLKGDSLSFKSGALHRLDRKTTGIICFSPLAQGLLTDRYLKDIPEDSRVKKDGRFLKEKLSYMGLTEAEMNEFIVYWLPRMEHNKYNLIAFQGDAYTDSAKLNITPTPDNLLRVFMAYIPLEEAVDVQPQQLETFERKGFTVVEWGGSEIKA